MAKPGDLLPSFNVLFSFVDSGRLLVVFCSLSPAAGPAGPAVVSHGLLSGMLAHIRDVNSGYCRNAALAALLLAGNRSLKPVKETRLDCSGIDLRCSVCTGTTCKCFQPEGWATAMIILRFGTL
jgi:hypothetical protein